MFWRNEPMGNLLGARMGIRRAYGEMVAGRTGCWQDWLLAGLVVGRTGGLPYPPAWPTRMIDIGRSPTFTLRVQSFSPSLATAGKVVPAGGSIEKTAGCGVPEAFRLIWTKAAKAGVAAGSASLAIGVRRAKSRCGATPWWAPSTGKLL